ncbi:hypothetical protein SEA_NANCYRAE_3 [Gordonia phage NancyRae]|uniref:Uncharacterized protein n=1 Tax=Gordonia phage NancyRae TaxID=2793698 RepID=A0A7T0M0K2_9CAUD|nr:hypothetical protein SEA_NANCYRAE_3 [Gordonia phage NancyRae]
MRRLTSGTCRSWLCLRCGAFWLYRDTRPGRRRLRAVRAAHLREHRGSV